MPDTVTPTEIIAYEIRLAWRRCYTEATVNESTIPHIHEAGDWLIRVADFIKTERATAAMPQKSGATNS